MPSTVGHYDQNLLAAAPAATKAQLQEGYATDLLDPSLGRSTPPTSSPVDPERGLVSKEYPDDLRAAPAAVPFWRTTKGMIIIGVAALVVVGAVVGGAVGGTRKKKNPDILDSGSLEDSSPPQEKPPLNEPDTAPKPVGVQTGTSLEGTDLASGLAFDLELE